MMHGHTYIKLARI